ncbi:hypothetical protein Cgig2_030261 [Carnegiea gigantea]|uniref:Endoglucanase n=1 Tax=Carnegiea gigantea TaxID=171969 RepID=A0A9Q1K1F8_9CARY|nr:hypothetical protein Cgig2_030261 [Carnegiea gigantea]
MQRGRYSTGTEAAIFYNSTMYWDEFLWGAAWLYYATGKSSYLQLATTPVLAEHAGAFLDGPDYGVLSWDNKLPGAQVLLTHLRLFLSPGYPSEEMLSTFHRQTNIIMCSYILNFSAFRNAKGKQIFENLKMSRTPPPLFCHLNHGRVHGRPQPLQYVVMLHSWLHFTVIILMLLICLAGTVVPITSQLITCATLPRHRCSFILFALIDYILGKNPRKMSYVVGYGNHYPKHVHHRGTSILTNKIKYSCKGGWKWRDSKKPNPNTIVGAMVAGPDRHDGFHDVRANYNYTDPALAGNAGLVAALVALSGDKSVGIDKYTIFSAVVPMYPTSPPPAPWKP